jgi:hypothetical protein
VGRLDSITFDARHAGSLARFWAAVLDGYDVAPYDDAEIERLVGLAATVFASYERWGTLLDPEGDEFCVIRA